MLCCISDVSLGEKAAEAGQARHATYNRTHYIHMLNQAMALGHTHAADAGSAGQAFCLYISVSLLNIASVGGAMALTQQCQKWRWRRGCGCAP